MRARRRRQRRSSPHRCSSTTLRRLPRRRRHRPRAATTSSTQCSRHKPTLRHATRAVRSWCAPAPATSASTAAQPAAVPELLPNGHTARWGRLNEKSRREPFELPPPTTPASSLESGLFSSLTVSYTHLTLPTSDLV